MPLFDSLSSNAAQNYRLAKMSTVPTTEDLKYILEESKKRRKPVELPFEHPHNHQNFLVRVQLGQGQTAAPVWTFIFGDGAHSKVLWSRPSAEVLMIQSKISTESGRTQDVSFAHSGYGQEQQPAPGLHPLDNLMWEDEPIEQIDQGAGEPTAEAGGNPFTNLGQAAGAAQRNPFDPANWSQTNATMAEGSAADNPFGDIAAKQAPNPFAMPAPAPPPPPPLPMPEQAAPSAFSEKFDDIDWDETVDAAGTPAGAPPAAAVAPGVPGAVPAAMPGVLPGTLPSTLAGAMTGASPAAPEAAPAASVQSLADLWSAGDEAAAPLPPPAMPVAAPPPVPQQTGFVMPQSSSALNAALAQPAAAPVPPPAPTAPPQPNFTVGAAPAPVAPNFTVGAAPKRELPEPFPLDWTVAEQVKAQLKDPATGFMTVPSLIFFLAQSVEMFKRDRTPCSIVALDISIQYPDGQVMPLPPEALLPLSERLQRNCGPLDHMAHLSAGEFIVVLGSTPSAYAIEFCRNLHAGLTETPLLPDAGGHDLALISIGAASVPDTATDPEVVLAAAFQARNSALQSKLPFMLFSL